MRHTAQALSALLAGALVIVAGLGPGTLGGAPATAPAAKSAPVKPAK